MKKKRASWDDYFMRIAREVATRATCDRKHVGAVIVRDRNILCTGYNGSIRGTPHCDEAGHLMEDGHCVRTIHAESNAILQAAKNGVRIDGAVLYVTASPCWPCFGLVANAGIVRVVFGEAYRAEDPGPKRVIEVARAIGIELVQHGLSNDDEPGQRASFPPIRVKHADLQRWSADSIYKSKCPSCVKGFLPVAREQNTLDLVDVDRCTWCGQVVIYLDEAIGRHPITRHALREANRS